MQHCSIYVSVIWIFLGQKVLFPMDLNRGKTIIGLFGRGADKLFINFACVIILISGQNPKLAGRREDSEDFLCSVLYFFLIRHGQKKS